MVFYGSLPHQHLYDWELHPLISRLFIANPGSSLAIPFLCTFLWSSSRIWGEKILGGLSLYIVCFCLFVLYTVSSKSILLLCNHCLDIVRLFAHLYYTVYTEQITDMVCGLNTRCQSPTESWLNTSLVWGRSQEIDSAVVMQTTAQGLFLPVFKLVKSCDSSTSLVLISALEVKGQSHCHVCPCICLFFTFLGK